MIILLLFLIFLALCAEAFFSGVETAFISVNFLKLMHLIEKKNKAALAAHDLLKKPDRLLTTALVGTNLSVIVSSACATGLFSKLIPGYSALLTILIMTPFSFIFCQLLPKTICRYNANRAVLSCAGLLGFSERLFWPLVNFFTFFANFVERLVNPKGVRKNPFLTKDEIKSLIKDISREGILEPQEKETIDKIFDMTLNKAADIMVPLKKVTGFELNEPFDSLKEKCRRHRFRRFPVFEGAGLKGMVNIFDLFYNSAFSPENWRSQIRPLLRVGHNESLDQVFSKMQPKKEMMAAVFEGEEMAGILTMEDLMQDITAKLTVFKKHEDR